MDRWLYSLTFGVILALLTFMVTLKRPICIESKAVEKIDRVSVQGTETVFRCPQKPNPIYSRYFDENLTPLESRVEALILYLNSFGGLKTPLKLVLDETQPMLFKIQDHEIRIGMRLAESSSHLERAILKIWINEKLSKTASSVELLKEVVADFLLYTYKGEIDLVDPISQLEVKLGEAKWPQVLKSVESYCDSPWKASEHYLGCHQLNRSATLTREEILNLSLRPLLTQSWVKAYTAMDLKERIQFFKLFPRFLQTQNLSSEKVIQMMLTENHPLKFGVKSLKKITDLMNSSSLMQNELTYREFYSEVTQSLQQSGVADSFAEAYFDYLIEVPNDMTNQSVFFKNLEKAALKYPQLQIAIKDKSQIWIFPNKDSLPLATFDQIRSRQMILMACLSLKEIEIKKFLTKAEKLLLIKGCEPDRVVKFDSLFKKGVSDFSRDNKQLAFIQFHLPSFELKAESLSHIRNFFELVGSRDMNKPEFQSLGWRQIQWFEESQAYRPQAAVDAIELFRSESLEKNPLDKNSSEKTSVQ